MDGETKAAQKGSLVKAYLSVGKVTSFFTQARQSNGGTFRKLEPFPKTLRWLSFKEQDSERACKGHEEEDEENFETAVSTTLLKDLALEDKPVSSSLDLMSSALYLMVAISEWYLIKDWWRVEREKNRPKSKTTGYKQTRLGMSARRIL